MRPHRPTQPAHAIPHVPTAHISHGGTHFLFLLALALFLAPPRPRCSGDSRSARSCRRRTAQDLFCHLLARSAAAAPLLFNIRRYHLPLLSLWIFTPPWRTPWPSSPKRNPPPAVAVGRAP